MALVLGIDAAWTASGSSSVALMQHDQSGRKVLEVASSYESFIAHAENAGAVDSIRPRDGVPDVPRLLKAAAKIGRKSVDVVAIDMPMSLEVISRRREADNAIARAFGAAGAGTHTVNADRPGPFGKAIVDAFLAEGYSLATASVPTVRPALIEVFPLAALVSLMKVDTRPPYKVTKTSRYWPQKTKDQRRGLLKCEWARIFAALRLEISDLGFAFPTDWSSWAALKPFEDDLDAVISAWVGTEFVSNRADPFGDSDAAIWVPMRKPRPARCGWPGAISKTTRLPDLSKVTRLNANQKRLPKGLRPS
jgi:predicted RNase H-like nuclease